MFPGWPEGKEGWAGVNPALGLGGAPYALGVKEASGPRGLGLEEWVQPVLTVCPKALAVTLMGIVLFGGVSGGLLGAGLSGDGEMAESQQSPQADRVAHREFLCDVTDGWMGSRG